MKLGKTNHLRTGVSMKLFDYGIVYKTKKNDKILKAAKTQDKIRKRTRGGKSLSEEIRHWRDTR